MLKLDALQKYENALLENFSPSVLRELKRSNWNGLLREIDRLYATMYHEWDALQKDVVDIEDAVRSLTWTVNPYTRDGEEPGEYAKKVAQVVQEALWAKAPLEPGSVGHTFQQLLGALVHHRFRGFNVHQIVWKKAGNLIFPARYIQLPPQFMVWETKAGHPDRLLLVEDGASADGIPFPAHKYIVALNTSGPDHPLYNATFYSLVNWFVAFKFGLGWFMEYAQKYGMPKQVLHYANEKERQQLIDDLSDETVLNTILLKSGGSGEYDIKFPSGGSASLPQAVLLQKAEEACHKAILGQTLTSDTSAHGGSLAQAKVHAGVQADVVMKIAESVADILNQQLVPAILQANFGRVQGLPIPELRCKLPQAVASIERAQFLKTALEIPGMKVTKTEAYEYLNLTQPSETDEVFEAKDPNAMGGGPGGGGFPGMGAGFPGGGKEADLPDAGAKDEVVTSAKAPAAPRDRNEAIKAWLSPLKKKLEEARLSGASLSDIREQISAWKPDTRALAGALADNIANGLLGSTRGNEGTANGNTEEVAAENPYGCNQHGHGHVDPCPYGGEGSNGMAGKSALQIAGGAENVNPDPDDDEEEKKKKEEEERKSENKDILSAKKKLNEAANDIWKAVEEFNPGAVYDAQEKMHKAAEIWAAAERKAKGDDQYFSDNNDPNKVLPSNLAEKISRNPTELKEFAQKRFANFVAKCEPVMEIDSDALEEILTEQGNRFVNCFEKPGVCSGSKPKYMRYRDEAESLLFGIESGSVSTKRPVYAYLRRNIEETIKRSSGYGDTCVTFKKEVRGRCTITGADSLNYYDQEGGFKTGSLLSNPKEGNCLLSWQIDDLNSGVRVEDVYNNSPYMEAQIYGPLTANDIQSIGVPFDNDDAREKANHYAEMLRRYNSNVKITKKANHYLVEIK